MKELKTIRGETMLVDDEDYETAKEYRWLTIGKKSPQVYTYLNGKERKAISYKRLILGINARMTSFKNGNPFDLRRKNIITFETVGDFIRFTGKFHREKVIGYDVTASKAAQGKGKKTSGKTTYIGTRYHPQKPHPWSSVIKYNLKNHYLGCFTEEEHAAWAYDKKAIEFYGEDATRNFPDLAYEELTEKLEKIKAEDAVLFHNYSAKRRQGQVYNMPKTSIYAGVAYDKATKNKKWRVNIHYQKKVYYLGNFDTEEEAALAYDKKAIELYGENATLNSPETKLILSKSIDESDPNKENVTVLDTKSGICNTVTILIEKENNEFRFAKSKATQGKSGNTGYAHTTTYIGAWYSEDRHPRPWTSVIKHNYKSHYLGSFTKDEYAAVAYDKKAIEIYGEDATVNFPDLTLEELTEKLKKIKEEEAILLCDHPSTRQQGTYRNFKEKTKTSEYVGVAYREDCGKWRAYISRRGKRHYLGNFTKEEDAARAYDKKAIELYGEDAKLNFPIK